PMKAVYQLPLIYLWYEKPPDRALELLRALHARHPHNPHFLRAIAEIEDTYLHDTAASRRSLQQLLEAARGRRGACASGQRLLQAAGAVRVAASSMAQTAAQLGIARELDARGDRDGAVFR